MTFFIRLKHWELFLLIVGFPMVLFLLSFQLTLSDMFEHMKTTTPDKLSFPKSISYSFIVLIVPTLLQFTWIYSVGNRIYKYTPKHVQLNRGLFRFFTLAVPAYFIGYMFCFLYILSAFERMFETQLPDLSLFRNIGLIYLFIFVGGFFALFCVIYSCVFCARVLSYTEKERRTSSGEYIGEFFCFLFPIVGIWIVQPRLNAILTNRTPIERDQPTKPVVPIISTRRNRQTPSTEKEKPLPFKVEGNPFHHDDEFDGIV